ncbi:MAG TPA: hypothetical protein ENI27_04480 [bacterium]|nr:hypothetical protein [bacterium]
MDKNKSIAIGVLGAAGILGLYLLVLTLVGSFSHALAQLLEMWYWLALLVIGFGVQLGLYSFVRMSFRRKSRGSTAEVAASGGISTGAMIACCAHHLVDVLPLIGLSAAALFLARYQLPFILLGIFSNLVGIVMMLVILQKHGVRPDRGVLKRLLALNLGKIRTVSMILAVTVVSVSFLLVSVRAETETNPNPDRSLELGPLVNDENAVTIEVSPLEFDFNEPVQFQIGINTHQGDLNFDLTAISLLEDNQGNILEPIGWDGSPSGGHHRSGVLTFPRLSEGAQWIRLTIRDVFDVPERIFEWKLF